MLGILYLLLCFGVGGLTCRLIWPEMGKEMQYTFRKKEASVPSFFLLLPAWFAVGVLPMAWLTYLTAYVCRSLKTANVIVFIVSGAYLAAGYLFLKTKTKMKTKLKTEDGLQSAADEVSDHEASDHEASDHEEVLLEQKISQAARRTVAFCRKYPCEIGYAILTSALVVLLMFLTLNYQNGQLVIGPSVHSDFAPHMAVIRSFSKGNNFPTVYPHFGGKDIKYHFFFQFLVGNLEFLGLRLDLAFNIPSIISMVSVFLLLYLIAYLITGKKCIGVMTGLFFAFRSSRALFDFLKQLPKNTFWSSFLENTGFIGTTAHEDWGLYNLNVYVNQRHLAFGMTVMLFVVYMMMSRLYASIERNGAKKLLVMLKDSFISKEGWVPKAAVSAAALGTVLGMTGFFHGSCVIACLLILFVMAIASDRRLEYLIIAVIAVAMVWLQTRFFTDGSVVSLKWYFGFLAENKTIFGVVDFILTLMGILPVMVAVLFFTERFEMRILILAFSMPLIFAFTISMTPDISVNHKYIMMSAMLWGLFAAVLIRKIWNMRKIGPKILSILLSVILIGSGAYEFTLVIRRNLSGYMFDLENPAIEWVSENASSKDIFLTSWDTFNPVMWGGASVYMGWPYYAWSAGYDTYYRDAQVKLMYEAQSKEELMQLLEENNISYIVIDRNVRMNENYVVNEELISNTFQCVFSQDEFQIYDVSHLI